MTNVLERVAAPSRMPKNISQRILPLNAEAIAQIHSSKHITSLQGVIYALLENSLDAGASRVEISVDWRRGGCTVNDNGIGIPSTEFGEHGSLGKLYCTSKRSINGVQTSESHGSSGTFLAELAAMSLLNIASAHVQSQSAAVLTLHHGKVIARRLPDATTSYSTLNQDVGTDVTVRDLFGNMPVRIKQRALAGEASSEDDKSWNGLKHGVVALLLAWPKPCSVKLRDTNAESKIVTISGHHHGAPNALTTKSLHQLAGKSIRSDPRDALPILFQSGFASPDSRSKWIPLSASTSAISLKGLICLDPAPTKQCQFLALGITPCSTSSGHNELYDNVTKVFSHSSFGIVEEPASVVSIGKNGKKTADGYTSKQLQTKKGVDRFPMYYIQLRFSNSTPDLARLSDSSLKIVVDILEAALTTWLESQHFRPRKKQRRSTEEQESPVGPLRPFPGTRSAVSDTQDDEHQGCTGHNTDTSRQRGKRGNIVDLSGRPVSCDMAFEPNLEAVEDLGTLSKMRFGTIKDRPQSALHRSSVPREGADMERAKSASSALPQDRGISMTVKKRRTLQAAAIEAGELGGIGKGRNSHSRLVDSAISPQTSDLARSWTRSSTGQAGIPTSDDFGTIDDADLLGAEQSGYQAQGGQISNEHDRNDNNVTWTDPVSKQVFRVNSRTGVVLPLAEEPSFDGMTSTRKCAAIDTALSSKGKPLSLARRSAIAKKGNAERPTAADDPKWLPGFLEQWNNPVFARQKEEPIPVASFNGPGPMEIDTNGRCCSHDHFQSRLNDNSEGTKLTKTALREAEVVAQVDTKFILCKMPDVASQKEEKYTLVLIDQHAASERVLLETLLGELCIPSSNDSTTIQTSSLSNGTARAQPLVVEISAKEVDLFTRHRAHFARWGILYELPSPERSDSLPAKKEKKESRMKITHLPTPVAERCSNFPALAIEMLRSEVWTLEDGSRKVATDVRVSFEERRHENQPIWLSLLSAIPPTLLTLLYSRACRSAIMFNDVLSRDQCVNLVEELGRCVFPFMCAHGRVSMVPLGDLGAESVHASGEYQGPRGQEMNAWLSLREDVEAEVVREGDLAQTS